MSLNLKRHYRLLILFVLVVVLCIVALRYTRIIAYTVPGEKEAVERIKNYENEVDLLDPTVVHEVVILMSEEDQQKMLATYQQTGEKDYFEVDVIIDGVRINSVGIRLKGNSSLRSAAGGGFGDRGFDRGNIIPPEGQQMPGRDRQRVQPPGGITLPTPGAGGDIVPPEGIQPPGGLAWPNTEGQGNLVPPQGALPQPSGQAAPGAAWPETASRGGGNLPYLIKFDRFVSGQRYQGLAEIALRTSGASGDISLLQEPVSNAILNEVGIPIARSVYGSVQMTGGEAKLYTIAEHMDQTYLNRILPDSDGVLYKVTQVGNDFSYLGEDPTLYANIFDQETAKKKADLAPLIDFIRFVNQSTDEEFAGQLAERLDIVAFADYLAVHNLLGNNDSLAGMGNNYYLYYDFDTEKFTILSWDMNESLGKLSMGSGSQIDIYWEGVGVMFGRGFGDAPGGRGKHLLLQRFLANAEFRALYKERYRLLYEQIYENDLLTPKIEAFAALVTDYSAEHSIVDQTAFDAAVSKNLSFVAQRHEYLTSTEMAGE